MPKEVPNNNDSMLVTNVLSNAPNRNDATGVTNNVRLTTMGAIQISMAAVYTDLPEIRDNDTKTTKVCADGNNHCPGKE